MSNPTTIKEVINKYINDSADTVATLQQRIKDLEAELSEQKRSLMAARKKTYL